LHKDILTKVGNFKSGIGSTIGNVKTGITQHVKNIHSSVSDKASKTIQFLTGGGSGGTVKKAPKPDIFNKDFLTNVLHKNTPVYDPSLPDSKIINIKVNPWSNTIKFPTDWNDALTAPITPANAYLPVEFKVCLLFFYSFLINRQKNINII